MGVCLAQTLAGAGERVVLLSRSNRLPDGSSGVEFQAVDARDAESVARAAAGAGVIYNTANVPYHRWTQDLPVLWRSIAEASARAGAHLVLATNLYAFGEAEEPFTETSEFRPVSRKGRVRADLETEALARAEKGDFRLSMVRASDFYGPGVKDAIFGERFLVPMLAGKPGQLFGNRSSLHSYTYVPDFAAALVAAGHRAAKRPETWLVPNAPAVRIPELETLLTPLLGQHGVESGARITTVGPGALRLAGLFMPQAGEVVEMLYEWNEDFVTDSSRTSEELAIQPTPLEDGLRAALAWYAGRMRAAA